MERGTLALSIAEEFEGDQEAARGGAGKARAASHFRDGQAFAPAMEGLDDFESPGEGKHEIGVGFH